MYDYSLLLLIILRYSCENNETIENSEKIIISFFHILYPVSVAMPPRDWKVNSAILIRPAHPVPSTPLCQIVTALLPVWSSAVKESSEAFAFKGDGLQSSFWLNAASVCFSCGCKVTGRWSKEQLKCVQNGSRTLEDTDNPNNIHMNKKQRIPRF